MPWMLIKKNETSTLPPSPKKLLTCRWRNQARVSDKEEDGCFRAVQNMDNIIWWAGLKKDDRDGAAAPGGSYSAAARIPGSLTDGTAGQSPNTTSLLLVAVIIVLTYDSNRWVSDPAHTQQNSSTGTSSYFCQIRSEWGHLVKTLASLY